MKMKKLILIVILGIIMISITGCKTTNNISIEQAKKYLEGKYGISLTIISNEKYESTTNSGTDKLFVFQDENGIEIHVFNEFQYGMFGSSYLIVEDYQVQYAKAHPEIFEELKGGEWNVEVVEGEEDYCKTMEMIMEYNEYNDIKKAFRFIQHPILEQMR